MLRGQSSQPIFKSLYFDWTSFLGVVDDIMRWKLGKPARFVCTLVALRSDEG